MSSVISNATPLVYLAKADRLDLLLSLFEEILIPEAVYEEVVSKGKQLGRADALIVEKAIRAGRISGVKTGCFAVLAILYTYKYNTLEYTY